MKLSFNVLSSMILCLATAAGAQTPSPAASTPAASVPQSSHDQAQAQAEAGEPRADTSPSSAASPGSPPAAPPSASSPTPPRVTPSRARAGTGSTGARPPGGGPKSNATDRIELGVATVTGDREQPKVMYIVPWKKSDIGDLSGKPMNSLLDEALAPIDRDEFRREVVYYQAVNADASQNGAPRRPAKQGEK